MRTFRVTNAGGVVRDLNQETSVGTPTWKTAGDVAQTPLGRVYVEGQAEALIPLPTQVRVSWTVRGETSLLAEKELTDLVTLLDGVTRLWHGKRYLTVLRLAESPPWERLFPRAAPLGYRGEHVYDLLDPYYRLTPTDESKRRTP